MMNRNRDHAIETIRRIHVFDRAGSPDTQLREMWATIGRSLSTEELRTLLDVVTEQALNLLRLNAE